MSALGITVLKHNVPWGPFTREQIEDGLTRGDFTVKYLASAPGLKEWLPLGEVLDYVERHSGPRAPSLPPVPGPRELPPIPEPAVAGVPAPISARPDGPPSTTPILAAPRVPDRPAPPPPPLPFAAARPPVIPEPERESQPAPKPESAAQLAPASFFLRGIAFLIDCAILFVPVGILFALGVLFIQVPRIWEHTDKESLTQQWVLLKQHISELAWLVAIGFGWLYGAGLEASASQATIGKRWVGIKVTDTQGERISFLQATGRYAAKYLSALPCFLGFMMALFSSNGRTLHDRLAKTRVVRA